MSLNKDEREKLIDEIKKCTKEALDPKKLELSFKLIELKTKLYEAVQKDPDFQKEYEDLCNKYMSKHLLTNLSLITGYYEEYHKEES